MYLFGGGRYLQHRNLLIQLQGDIATLGAYFFKLIQAVDLHFNLHVPPLFFSKK
jgi:hypothetical protein